MVVARLVGPEDLGGSWARQTVGVARPLRIAAERGPWLRLLCGHRRRQWQRQQDGQDNVSQQPVTHYYLSHGCSSAGQFGVRRFAAAFVFSWGEGSRQKNKSGGKAPHSKTHFALAVAGGSPMKARIGSPPSVISLLRSWPEL